LRAGRADQRGSGLLGVDAGGRAGLSGVAGPRRPAGRRSRAEHRHPRLGADGAVRRPGALPLPRGRVVGGSSAVNATFALRGSPFDYDRWRQPGWSFADVGPSFVQLESDRDFPAAAYHGAGGPAPIRRYLGAEQSALAVAAIEGLRAAGIPEIADRNAPYAVGVAPLPVKAVVG